MLQNLYNFLTSPGSSKEGYYFLPFHGALLPLLLLEIAYVALVFRIGPWYMKNRAPFKLTTVLKYYNLMQIVFNALMAMAGVYLYLYKYVVPISCMTVLPWEHPLKYLEIYATLAYLFNKFLDLFDTIFFVLRKSYKQVSFLHVYHHILMTVMGYIYVRVEGSGGHPVILGTMNAIVHVIMYGYYFVSATRPHMKHSLWWKKYITQIQILQFILALLHNLLPFMQPDCRTSRIFAGFSVIQAIFMLYLFGSFYKRNYVDVTKKSRIASKCK